jgi:NAD(P)-dependent dehydrogenase (short-subunit alcohol dehydrogenase family)
MTSLDRFRLDGRVALVTGASRGIGQAIAVALAGAGASVVVSSRKREAIDETAKLIRERGGQAHAVVAHAGVEADQARLVKEAVDVFGGVDVVVMNAATNPVFGPALDADGGVFDKVMQVNVKGPFLLAKAAQPWLCKSGKGALIFISSVGGVSPEPLLGLYSVSKAAVLSLSKVLAKEWGPDVRSNVICPGIVKTKFAEAIWSNDAIVEATVKTQPIPRVAEPDEIAGMALFLASDASSYCTGGVYVVDGGHLL